MIKRSLLPILSAIIISSCMVEKGEVNIRLPGAKNFRHSEITKAIVTNVQIINDQLVITGTNLNVVTNIKTENASKSFSESFTIESKTSSQIIANSNSPLSFAVNSLFNLVLSNSYGAATFQINFSLCDATINGKGINCSVVANDKDVLSYDSLSDTWKPRQVNGLNYLGTFDASPGIAPTAQPSGSYYVISVSGTIGAINFDVGDWIVSNGSAYQKIDNSTAIISVFGRTGAVSGIEGDYSLDLLSDVDLLTTPPTAGKILKYNGTHWVVSDDLSSGGAGSVSSSEIADGAIATADLANASVTDAKINSVAASKITGTVNGSQIGAGVITNSHIAAGAAIDYSKLNITNNTIPYAHINVGAGEIAQDRIAGFSTALANLLTGTITNGDTTHAPTGDAVFDALGLKLNLTGGTLSVGTINGVPTPVNGDDIVNKAYVDSAVTGATTTANDKVSKTGDTMTGALVLPSNGLTVGTNQLTVSGGNVGIGTNIPSNILTLEGSNLINNGILLRNNLTPSGNNYPSIAIENYADTGTGHPFIALKNAAGSFGAPQVSTLNSALGSIIGYAHNGTTFVQGGRLDFRLRGAPGSTYAESDFVLSLGNSSNGQLDRFVVKGSDGYVGIGTTTPSQKLDVVGNINATQLCIAGDCKSAWPTGLGANSVTSTEITDGSIMNADINAGAAIAQSKISGLTTDLSNKQPLDAGLTNLSTYNTNGILVQSADNTFVGRSIAGTANRLDVTNGDGVSGNPTLNINPTLLPSPTASGYFLKSTGADASVWSLLSSGDITTALGFTPINKAGDTLSTGTIAFNAIGTLSLGYTPTNLTDATSKSYVDNLVATAANQWTESSGNVYRNTGSVGIGTATPLVTLQVTGSKFSPSFPVNSFLVDNAAQAADIGGGVAFGGYGDNASTAPIAFGAIRAGKENNTSGNYLGYLSLMYRNQSLLQEGLRISSSGNIGIGTTNPTAKITTYDELTDSAIRGANIELRARSNTNGSYSHIAGVFKAQETIASGATNSNGLTGIWSVAFRNNYVGNIDNGTLNELKGLYVQYGHYNTEASSTPITTSAYGMYLSPHYTKGSITNLYDIYAQAGATGGTVGTHYGLYILGPTKKNYIEGSLGLGTASPSAKLEVKDTNSTSTLLYVGDSNTNGSTGLYFNRWAAGTNPMGIQGTIAGVGAGDITLQAQGGNVGIGTTSPSYKLQVTQTSTTVPAMMIGGGFAGGPRIQTYGLDADPLARMGLGTDMSGESYDHSIYTSAPAQNGKITFGQYDGTTFTERMRIHGNGNVGVGTTSPNSKLEVNGQIAITANSDLLFKADSNDPGDLVWFNSGNDERARIHSSSGVNKMLEFSVGNPNSTKMVIRESGNVGIATTTPREKLDISGNGRMIFGPNSTWGANLIVGGNGWTGPDATVTATDGNLHLESKTGAYTAYINWYGATGGLKVGNGTSGGYGPINASAFTVTSDIRLKENIKEINDSLSKISQIRGVTYKYSDKKFNQETQIGVIAQEVQKVFPEAVLTDEDGILSVNYSILIAPVIESIKEIYNKVMGHDKAIAENQRAIASLKVQTDSELKKKDLEIKKLKAQNDMMKSYLCQKDPKAPFCHR